jgi:hypothetical protein
MKLGRIRWAEHTACTQEIQEIFFWGAGPVGSKPLGGHSHRSEDNINIDLQPIM